MKLPYRGSCYIPKEKLTRFLLNSRHPDGRSKAVFFTKMGFNRAEYQLLGKELLLLAKNNNAKKVGGYENMSKYVISGLIRTPIGRKVSITTVWETNPRTKRPRLITAYPLKRKKFTKSV